MIKLMISNEVIKKLHIISIYSDNEFIIPEDFQIWKKIPFSDTAKNGVIFDQPANFVIYHKLEDGSNKKLDVITGITQIEITNPRNIFLPTNEITISIEDINNTLAICGSGNFWGYDTEPLSDMIYKMTIY